MKLEVPNLLLAFLALIDAKWIEEQPRSYRGHSLTSVHPRSIDERNHLNGFISNEENGCFFFKVKRMEMSTVLKYYHHIY